MATATGFELYSPTTRPPNPARVRAVLFSSSLYLAATLDLDTRTQQSQWKSSVVTYASGADAWDSYHELLQNYLALDFHETFVLTLRASSTTSPTEFASSFEHATAEAARACWDLDPVTPPAWMLFRGLAAARGCPSADLLTDELLCHPHAAHHDDLLAAEIPNPRLIGSTLRLPPSVTATRLPDRDFSLAAASLLLGILADRPAPADRCDLALLQRTAHRLDRASK